MCLSSQIDSQKAWVGGSGPALPSVRKAAAGLHWEPMEAPWALAQLPVAL